MIHHLYLSYFWKVPKIAKKFCQKLAVQIYLSLSTSVFVAGKKNKMKGPRNTYTDAWISPQSFGKIILEVLLGMIDSKKTLNWSPPSSEVRTKLKNVPMPLKCPRQGLDQPSIKNHPKSLFF